MTKQEFETIRQYIFNELQDVLTILPARISRSSTFSDDPRAATVVAAVVEEFKLLLEERAADSPAEDLPEWERMKKIEPGLAELEAKIRAVKDDPRRPSFCASAIWYANGGPKDKLQSLVGARARSVELRSGKDYDTAYHYLRDLLPACRKCSCA